MFNPKIKQLNITKAIRNTVGGVALFPNSYVMDVPQPNLSHEIDFIFVLVEGYCKINFNRIFYFLLEKS